MCVEEPRYCIGVGIADTDFLHREQPCLKEVSRAHGGQLDGRLNGEDSGEEVVAVLGEADHEGGHAVLAELVVVVVLDVVAVEAHEHDVDDDAEGDGQLDEGVEHDEGQHLADLGPDSMGKK